MKPNISRKNKKIHRCLIWNLPSAKTCPGQTKLCAELCYAKNSEEFYHNVVPQSRQKNFEISKSTNFVEIMLEALRRRRIRVMRIHESGDFYSQRYLNDWVTIMSELEDFTFFAYTKSYALQWDEALKLENFYLRYSVDATTKKILNGIPQAILSSQPVHGVYDCPGTASKGHAVKCMKDCHYCITSRESVRWVPHGTHRKKIILFEKPVLQTELISTNLRVMA